MFNGGVEYYGFNIGKYTDSDELITYLQLKMIYDLDAYERYILISIDVGDSHLSSYVNFKNGVMYHNGGTLVQSGVKPDGTKWMTILCALKYRDTLDGSESGWGGNAYFEYTDEDGIVRIMAVQDGSAGSVYALDTLSNGRPPYDIYLKDGTDKLLNSSAVRRLTSSDFSTSVAEAEPAFLKEVCEPYLFDYWNYTFKLGDFEPADYISDPDMLNYANAVKYGHLNVTSGNIRELKGIMFRGMDFGSISDTRTWVYWKYDLAILWEDFTTVDTDAGTGCTAYFEIDKTDNGYELYRAFTDFELSDFGLPDEPLSFPLPDIDLKAAVNDRLNLNGFAVIEPVLHYDGMGGLGKPDDWDVTVSFGLPNGWNVKNGSVYPVTNPNSGNIKIIETKTTSLTV